MQDLFGDGHPYEAPLDDRVLESVEAELGKALPRSYVDLCRVHNGGTLAINAHPAPSPTTWARDHIGVHSIAAVGRKAGFSLCGELGSRFWLTEWGYPDIGIYFADCPSAGHDMLALDYRAGGEPTVVHVDEEVDYRITVIAPSFESFLAGLCDEKLFPI